MEWAVLGMFCGALLVCVALDISILYALLAGLFLFCAYGLLRGYALKDIGAMLLSGIRTSRKILLVFILIGMLTALWRACGTIPVLICRAAELIRPETLLPLTFLLNCAVSVLTGTAFGTAATMGVICMAMGRAAGAEPVLLGGAILSGVFFGDRCSPVSTSALLVSELTGTSVYDNIRGMLRTALLPFLLSCGVYLALGLMRHGGAPLPELTSVFSRALALHLAALLPAAVLLVLSLLRVNVMVSMSASILTAAVLCIVLQGTPLTDLPALLLFGYAAPDVEAAALLDGGGILSMLRPMAIVCISSSYSGIFSGTGLLDNIKSHLTALCRRISPFGGILTTSVLASMVAANQTLAIILTHQLCGQVEPESKRLALALEDTAVVVSPLVPWSIACAVPLASVGAPTESILAACFLYLLPLCSLLGGLRKGHLPCPQGSQTP